MKKVIKTLLIFLLSFFFLRSTVATAQNFPSSELQKYLQSQRAKHRDNLNIGVHIRRAENGEAIFSYNGEKTLIPASVVKIITSVVALKMLGSNYRFPTELFVDRLPFAPPAASDKRKSPEPGRVGRLYVRGYGDPSFTEEQLFKLVRALKDKGVNAVTDIVLDSSLFVDPHGPLGPQPYQAGLSALSLNHNCYAVHTAPTLVNTAAMVNTSAGIPLQVTNRAQTVAGKSKKLEYVQSPESAVAFANLNTGVIDAFKSFAHPELRLTVRGSIGVDAEPTTEYFTVPSPPLYFGSALRRMLQDMGVAISGSILQGEVPAEAVLFHTAHSKDLALILRDLNFYSNNFIADQVLYALGQDTDGFFRSNLALQRLTEFVQGLGVTGATPVIKDGSGLDRGNLLTAEQLSAVLSFGYRDFSIAPDFIASLSRYGMTGTLKKRKLSRDDSRKGIYLNGGPAHSVWGKTGTLTGVSSLVGFLEGKTGARYSYAILVNGPLAKDTATSIEDSILKITTGLQ